MKTEDFGLYKHRTEGDAQERQSYKKQLKGGGKNKQTCALASEHNGDFFVRLNRPFSGA